MGAGHDSSARQEAGLNHGLVHYDFGSMEEVFLQVLERYTARLTARQRELYASDAPFVDKWRVAMAYLVDEEEAEYQKIWCELQAMSWSRPEMRARVGRILSEWQSVLVPTFREGPRELGVDRLRYPVEAIVWLVLTFNEGVILERMMGVDSGHQELLNMIDRMLVRMQRSNRRGRHDESSLPGRRRVRGVRRCEGRLRGVRHWSADDRVVTDVDDYSLPILEAAGSLPRAAFPRGDVRWSGQWPFRSSARSHEYGPLWSPSMRSP